MADRSARQAVETYIRAKDENRPYLMERAFAADATLEMVVNSGTISFPPIVHGLESISVVLVRRFDQTYENVHTFCLATPPPDGAEEFSCGWLVGMSEKENRRVRTGCGRYDWRFQDQGLVQRLTITIELMESLEPSCLAPVMGWLSRLPYPWCTVEAAMASLPALDDLARVRRHLAAAFE